MQQKKTLKIVIKQPFFNQIKEGKKTKEYRLIKPFWVSRLVKKDKTDFIKYDYIEFINGYHKNAPRLIVEHIKTVICKKIPQFIIYLGKVLYFVYLYTIIQ